MREILCYGYLHCNEIMERILFLYDVFSTVQDFITLFQ